MTGWIDVTIALIVLPLGFFKDSRRFPLDDLTAVSWGGYVELAICGSWYHKDMVTRIMDVELSNIRHDLPYSVPSYLSELANSSTSLLRMCLDSWL